jgi:hypothetical protein
MLFSRREADFVLSVSLVTLRWQGSALPVAAQGCSSGACLLTAAHQRSAMAKLSLARNSLRANQPLHPELAHFLEYYDPVKQALRQEQPAQDAAVAGPNLAPQPQRTAPRPPVGAAAATASPARVAPPPPERHSSISQKPPSTPALAAPPRPPAPAQPRPVMPTATTPGPVFVAAPLL